MSGSLSHSPADIIQQLLIDLSLATDPVDSGSWPVFSANEPDSPDSLIVIYDTAGLTFGRIQRSGETCEHKGIQISVRGTDSEAAFNKIEAIATALDETVNKNYPTIGSSSYIVYSVNRQSGPIAAGREPGTNRMLFTLNATVVLNQLS